MTMGTDSPVSEPVAPAERSASSSHYAATSDARGYTGDSTKYCLCPSTHVVEWSSDKVAPTDLRKGRKTRDKLDAWLPGGSHGVYMVAAVATNAMNSEVRMAMRKIVGIESGKLLSTSKSREGARSTYESRKWR